MRSKKIVLALGLLILGATAASSVLAQRFHHHHHHHSRFSFGLSVGAPWYYPAPYYYAPYYYPAYYPPYPYVPAPAVAEAPAYIEQGDSGPAYVERGDERAPPARRRAEGSWYFCPESNAYYPYVKQCAGGWQRVAPRPPAGPGAER